MPTYGPFTRVVEIPYLAKVTRYWYRRKPITDFPLYYHMWGYYSLKPALPGPDGAYLSWSLGVWNTPDSTPLENQIYQKAYGRFRSEVNQASAQLGADFAERKQSFNSLVTRVTQLTNAARALKKGNFKLFLKTLGIKRTTRRKVASDAGGLWLEYSFGWKPLVDDIYSAVQVLQQPLRSKIVKGRAKGSVVVTTVINPTYYRTYTWLDRFQMRARVIVDSWIGWKANELGLTNPLSIAWEVVPFSFVVDWFVPIGKYLQSLTDFVGLSFDQSCYTWYGILDRDDVSSGVHRIARRMDLLRSLGLPAQPRLRSRFTGFYSARGANAIALLSSTLKDLPKVKLSRFS